VCKQAAGQLVICNFVNVSDDVGLDARRAVRLQAIESHFASLMVVDLPALELVEWDAGLRANKIDVSLHHAKLEGPAGSLFELIERFKHPLLKLAEWILGFFAGLLLESQSHFKFVFYHML
jgi:hypothetical protein